MGYDTVVINKKKFTEYDTEGRSENEDKMTKAKPSKRNQFQKQSRSRSMELGH